MIKKLRDLKTAHANRRTYTIGLLQAQVYRLLKNRTRSILDPHNINTLEWALLGLVYESEDEGMRSVALAKQLLVDLPFITVMVHKMEKQSLVKRLPDSADKRAKLIKITSKGKIFVDTVEQEVKEGTSALTKGLSAGELITYVSVLNKLKNNASADELTSPVKNVPKGWKE